MLQQQDVLKKRTSTLSRFLMPQKRSKESCRVDTSTLNEKYPNKLLSNDRLLLNI